MPRCTNRFAKNIKGSKVKSVLITEKKTLPQRTWLQGK